MAVPKFESKLQGSFQVTSWKNVIIDELPDDPNDVWGSAGPFHPAPSNYIVQTDQPIHVHTQWNVKGALASILGGEWRVAVYFEKYGGGEANPGEYMGKTAHIQSLNHTYNMTITVPANDLKPGLYNVAIAITFFSDAGVPLPVAGFADLGMVQYYEAK
ncbi:MAG: hypothetical protein KDC54_01155 [Lewinella sp.]|nr:hypothetical protein [Lewinella sp.]